MLTYNLVYPSYLCLKLSRILQLSPIEICLGTGEFHYKSSTRQKIFRYGFYSCALLKEAQLLSYIFTVIRDVLNSSVEEYAVSSAIINSLVAVVLAVSVIWNEIMHAHSAELITLLRSLEIRPTLLQGKVRRLDWNKRKTNEKVCPCVFAVAIRFLMRKINMMRRYFHGFKRDFLVLYKSSMTFKELVTLIVPLLINIFVPFVTTAIVLEEPFHGTFLSALPENCHRITAVVWMCRFFDFLVTVSAAVSLFIGFFIGLLFESVYLRRFRRAFDDLA